MSPPSQPASKKPRKNQKKPGGAMSPPSQPASKKPRKKRTMQGADADQAIDDLTDVKAVSAVDEKKPEEAMPSTSKKRKMQGIDADQTIDELNDIEAESSMDQPVSKRLRKNRKKQGTDADQTIHELNDVTSKSSMDQKKPEEAMSSARKKQKMQRTDSEQAIYGLNDVMAESGVRLRDEEEQLFGGVNLSKELEKLSGINVKEVIEHGLDGTKEESGKTEAEHKYVQEEEKPLFLEIGPLRAKIGAIAAKFGLSSVSEDAERCLSIGAEERLRCMIQKLIRLSKQRWDLEKHEHRVCVTDDLSTPYLIVAAEKKAALEKEQHEWMEKVEREKHERKEKEYGQVRNDQWYDYNVATRAALGECDALSRFEWMAAHGRAERQEILVTGSDSSRAGISDETAGSREHEQRHEIGDGPALGGKSRSITLKDLEALLERDEKLAKSTIMYKLLLMV